ncbi:MAG TPA: DOPA 4,5-dioxygenase family protein [Stellaceae bacterium]|nr:DOPA 4,5-dioxygenase family protein [Stellaceae bacterium]
MTEDFIDTAGIEGYHAHVYYDAATRGVAERLRHALGERFPVRLGRWHDEPVGPHPVSMYQAAFDADVLADLLPWLMLNRGELNILVHPLTGDDYSDHARFALWLGASLPLRLEALRRGRAPE